MKRGAGVRRATPRLWPRLAGGLGVWLMAVAAWAGHGFMSSFGNIEWLPAPGETPDSTWYTFDSWEEESQLWRAGNAAGQTPLYLSFAREKLAEVEAMVAAENADAAQVAADRYQDYMARLLAGLDPDAPDTQGLAATAATALLEHQYILAIIYEELPAGSRAVVPLLLKTAQTRYADLSRLLSRTTKGSLFFKEEEVRWNVQMVLRAEEDEGPGRPDETER